MNLKIACLHFCLTLSLNFSYSQMSQEQIKTFLYSGSLLRSTGITYSNEIKEFYKQMDYRSAWIGNAAEYNREILLDLIRSSERLGLEQKDYQFEFIQTFNKFPRFLTTLADSLAAEIKFSDAAIHFFGDFAYGNTRPSFGYDGLGFNSNLSNIPRLLAECTIKNQLCLLEKWEPPLQEIKLIRQKIQQIKDRQFLKIDKEEKITSTEVNQSNRPLLARLYYLGISEFQYITTDTTIKETLKEAQRQFNLPADGSLRNTILNELNTPISIRLQQLALALNYYRWLFWLAREQPVIVVNIPAAYLKVYHKTGTLLEMKMIVGKLSTPTPTLSSRVTDVILYPYWMVPKSIAIKELLPAIKRNPGFIDVNNYQLINSQGKIVNAYKVNWEEMNASNFPYVIRQSTGCDNALGLIKLNFTNPFGVYLHDTPNKSLFSMNKRYLSHGCMRMEKPMELGHLILKNNRMAIDTLTEKGCLMKQSPVIVPADEKMPVIVWYNPVGTDNSGRVIYYKDIYRKFSWKNTAN